MHVRLIFAIGKLLSLAIAAAAFQFPKIKFVGLSGGSADNNRYDENEPKSRVTKGPGGAALLRQSLENHCKKTDTVIQWEPNAIESYEVADVIFQQVSQCDTSDFIIAFPCINRPADLEQLSLVLQSNKCKQLLGLDVVECELYPSSPAPYIYIKFDTTISPSAVDTTDVHSYSSEFATSATKRWLKDFLGKYRLCPYTSSATRAAVGLSSVNVPVGGVHIQVAESTNIRNNSTRRAANLVSAFWTEVKFLLQSSQDQWATSLVVFPEYDNDFQSFVQVCDNVIEPTVIATRATEFIGRAWFHPQYDADQVGHTDVIAGHAVPHKMVEGFMDSLALERVEYEELARANNLVRETPHATINILRRSQLKAAAEYEKGLGTKRPKPNSIYVRNAIRLSNTRITSK
jgi:hypothetical protein